MYGDGFNQIFFMTPDGTILREPRGAPVIRCVIPKTVEFKDNEYHMNWKGEDWRAVWALVDTGADSNYIDVKFAARLGLSPSGMLNVQGATSTVRLPYFEHIIYLVGTNQVITGEFASANLSDNGRHYPLIIGSQTLFQGALTFDRWSTTFKFDSLPR